MQMDDPFLRRRQLLQEPIEHPLLDIRGDHFSARPHHLRNRDGEISRSAADIQHRHACMDMIFQYTSRILYQLAKYDIQKPRVPCVKYMLMSCHIPTGSELDLD